MAKIAPKGKKVTGTRKKDKIVSTGKGVWKKALTVKAGAGNDLIDFRKSKYKNIIYGDAGNDIIYGGTKNDKITGGKNNDVIYTGKGTNIVYLNKGDGKDTLYHQGKKTTIAINKSNKADKVSFTKQGNDLVMTYQRKGVKAKKAEAVTVKDYFNADGSVNTKIASAVLLNSKKYKNKKLQQIVKSYNIVPDGNKLIGSASGDKLNATAASQYINGGLGNDTIKGLSGNNTLLGGAGDDDITGGSGNDSIDGGDGNDTINGGAGDDNITGGSGNDQITGGADNDTINAGTGNNTIYINKGDGSDTVINGKGNDTIVFSAEKSAEGENPASVSAAFVGNDLVITGKNGGTKTTLKDYANGDHSVKWLTVGGKTVRTDSIVPLNNINEPNTVSEYNIKSIYNGTSRPDYINISSTEYGEYGPTMVVNADKGDDVIEINSIFASGRTGDGRLYGVKVDAGEGNDNIILNSGALAQVVLKAGNGNDTISGIGYAGSGGYEGSGGYQLYNGSGGYVKYMNTGVFNQVVLDEGGLKGLLTRKLGSTEYILGKQVGNDLIIKLTNGETLTIESYYKYKYNKNTVFYEGFDGCTPISKILKTDDITEIKLNSQKTNYKDLSDVIHFIDAQDSGQYNIQLGDSDKNCIAVNNGEYYNIELGNGNNNEIIVGDYYLEEPLDASADIKVGNGNRNVIALFKTGSYSNVTVGDGNGNSIYIDSPNEEPVDTNALINVGHGDDNSISVRNNGDTKILIGNGNNNSIYANGTGNTYTYINTDMSIDKYYNGDESIGSCYMNVGYNSGDTISTTRIKSFGNDTIKGAGIVNVNIENPTDSTKIFVTNFGERDVTKKSQTIVNLGNAERANINIMSTQYDDYMPYFSLIKPISLGAVSPNPSYSLVYGALDEARNYVDGEIYIPDAYIPIPNQILDPLNPTPKYAFRFNADEGFIWEDEDGDYRHKLRRELQLYDMAKMGSHNFDQTTDIVYNSNSLLVKGTAGNDEISVDGAEVRALGCAEDGYNMIHSLGNDVIYTTSHDIVDMGDNEEASKEIYVSAGAQADIIDITEADSTTLIYNDNNIKDVMFSFYGESDAIGTYLTLHAFDENGNIINRGDKIYGQMTIYGYLDFDDKDESENILIDNKLTVFYNQDAERKIGNMVQYVDMAVINDEFDVYNYGGMQYIGKGYYVQGTESNDKYWWDFAGDVTINDKTGNDTLTINANDGGGILRGARNTKFIFDVSVTRDAETSKITGVTMGDDIIFVSDFNSGGEIENFFSTSASTRDSVATLTVKDYFKSGGTNMDNIKLDYSTDKHYYDVFNYNAFINKNDCNDSDYMDKDGILADVTAWLNTNSEYSSVMDAINRCGDQTKLDALCACYSKDHNFEYWTKEVV